MKYEFVCLECKLEIEVHCGPDDEEQQHPEHCGRPMKRIYSFNNIGR